MIDRNPAGRFIVSESPYILSSGLAGREYGEITKISGKRIYFKDERDENFEKFILKFSAVCDTLEEALKLIMFSHTKMLEISEILRKNKREYGEFFQ